MYNRRDDALIIMIFCLLFCRYPKKYRVTAIELGAQSMSDKVLDANERGHSAEDVRKASSLIKKYDLRFDENLLFDFYIESKQ